MGESVREVQMPAKGRTIALGHKTRVSCTWRMLQGYIAVAGNRYTNQLI